MAAPVKTVAILGASGNLGAVLLDHFSAQEDSPLKVTAVTREGSDSKFPDSLKVAYTDFSSASLEQVLRGQDVVIDLLPPEAKVPHERIIDAAVKSGVKRFFPSEYGVRSYYPEFAEVVAITKKKRSIVKYLEKTQDKMSWTALLCNPWTDFCVVDGLLGFDLKNKKAQIYNGGDVPFSAGLRELAGKAFYALLTNVEQFEEAKNQYIHIFSYTTTQNEILATVENILGEKFEVTHVRSEEVLPQAEMEAKEGKNRGLAAQVQAIFYSRDAKGNGVGDFRPLGDWSERLKLRPTNLEDDLKGPLTGNWRGILHWQPEELPDYSLTV
ncbi:NAD(P)-binding protein [Aaosphaeria arxii CBS 175.79]|uniref:NAD(P)-binding protein n=1 Tax=Aaosphaeria arxii CBS 175.79 TaxID=1450172 RepID=A0A6A5Y4A9_9PLEO|nr:NAD(P)-binding protein [Aaosphaeria arxii CBS 175.79]KAF2020338.1 NAD(P)-binding protein [Aaosphaeria arxii CBS 175.79]